MGFKKGDKLRCVDNSGVEAELCEGLVYAAKFDEFPTGWVQVVGTAHPRTQDGGFAADRFELVEPEVTFGASSTMFQIGGDSIADAFRNLASGLEKRDGYEKVVSVQAQLHSRGPQIQLYALITSDPA